MGDVEPILKALGLPTRMGVELVKLEQGTKKEEPKKRKRGRPRKKKEEEISDEEWEEYVNEIYHQIMISSLKILPLVLVDLINEARDYLEKQNKIMDFILKNIED